MKLGGKQRCNNHHQWGHRWAVAGNESEWGQRGDEGLGQLKWGANDDATTNHRREWHRRAAAGDESIWGQRGDEGIEYPTLVGDDEIGRRTTMQVPTNDWSGKGGKSRRRRERR